jgi:hypothetical protein
MLGRPPATSLPPKSPVTPIGGSQMPIRRVRMAIGRVSAASRHLGRKLLRGGRTPTTTPYRPVSAASPSSRGTPPRAGKTPTTSLMGRSRRH